MRIIYDPNGNDVTSAVQTLLQSGRSFYMANLYSFIHRTFWLHNTTGSCAFFGYTDADNAISVKQLQLFATGPTTPTTLNGGLMSYQLVAGILTGSVSFFPEKIQRAKLSYGVGLSSNDVDIEWFIDDNVDYFVNIAGNYGPLTSPPSSVLPMKQAMTLYRAFDDAPFWIHRAIFSPTVPPWPGALIGCFTDGTGQIVAGSSPFVIGSQGFFTVPFGATQIQMGMNDTPYSDNSGNWVMNVNGSNTTVLGTAAPWSNSGGINSLYPLPSTGQTAPTVVSGLTAGQNIPIYWVSGVCNLHLSVQPFFNPDGWAYQPGGQAVGVPGQFITSTKTADQMFLVGTTLMHRGFIRKTEASPQSLKITVGSLMQIIQDLQVPTQLIEPGNRDVQFLPSPNPTTTGSILTTPITVVNSVVIKFVAGVAISANQLQDCWVTFQPTLPSTTLWAPQNGLPPISTPGWKIQSNNAAILGGTVTVIFYDPPIIPQTPAGVNIFTQTGGTTPGFANVPPPEVSL